MHGTERVRRAHRGLGIVFTAAVALNFAAMAFGPPPAWVTYAPLPPLLLLLLSGLTLFARPHVARWRGARKGPA